MSDYKGFNVEQYFYPKDNTSGCTKEACDFRNDYSIYKNHGIVILGVSPDSVKSHAEFSGKLDLPFTLLSDTDKIVLKLYGAWGKKSMYGWDYMDLIRKTVLIDKNGIIQKIFPKVKVNGHSKEVIAYFGIK